jgi:molecular chaperone HscA
MHIVNISEPNSGKEIGKSREIAVGIDFGTTNSLISISRNGIAEVINDNNGRGLLPSIVDIEQFRVRSVKRLLGKSIEELEKSPYATVIKDRLVKSGQSFKIFTSKGELTLPEIASQVFKTLKTQAEDYLKCEVKKAVITVPAHFDDTAKGSVMLAAKIAGFEVMRLIAEPTAAAYSYGINNNVQGCYLVYDLGGGTFDVSILNIQQGILQVIATGGDNMLGGDDIDELVAMHLVSKYQFELSEQLLLFVRGIKEKLSENSIVKEFFLGKEIEFTLGEFGAIILPLIKKTIYITKETLSHSNHKSIEGIVMVGGSSRIPLITKLLQENFNVPILTNIDPDKCVSIGAAMQAENLVTLGENLLIDVVSLSLGIEMYGGLVEKIILRNSPLPISVTKEFTTHVDNQTGMKFHVVQGERELAKDCRSLANFELKGLPSMKAGSLKVSLTFSMDVNGILSVSAIESRSSRCHTIEVKPSYGLSNVEVDEILRKAFENAKSDHELRLLETAKIEAESLINLIEKSLEETPDIIKQAEIDLMKSEVLKLKKLLQTSETENILDKVKLLEQLSVNLANARLNQAVFEKLSGKNIDEIK